MATFRGVGPEWKRKWTAKRNDLRPLQIRREIVRASKTCRARHHFFTFFHPLPDTDPFQDGVSLQHAVPPRDGPGAPASGRRSLPAPRGARAGLDDVDCGTCDDGGAAGEGDEGAECGEEEV